VFSKPLRAQIHDLTGVSLNRRKLQAIREPLGIVFSKVVGAGGAKMSRRVRLQRFRFVARRMEEDAREPSKRPMRVYSDESYCNANTAANNTWVLSERVWEETILQDAIEKIATGDTVEMPTNMVGSMCHAGAQLSKPKSGKGGRAVIINALYALPADLSDDEKACIDGDVVMGGPVDGVLPYGPRVHLRGITMAISQIAFIFIGSTANLFRLLSSSRKRMPGALSPSSSTERRTIQRRGHPRLSSRP
jgi:hypothetical protein